MKIGIVRVCQTCGGEVSPFVDERGRPRKDLRFCSRSCYYKRKSGPVEAETRLWAKVNKFGTIHPTLGACWEWTGSVDVSGYGYLSVNAVEIKAHRFSWSLVNGEIPDGLVILHKCDNPPCVNPDHLQLGTLLDNNLDMKNKGRHQHGERHSHAKLTENDVLEILAVYIPRHPINGASALGRKYGVSREAIREIIKGKNWKHLQRTGS